MQISKVIQSKIEKKITTFYANYNWQKPIDSTFTFEKKINIL